MLDTDAVDSMRDIQLFKDFNVQYRASILRMEL